MFGLSESVSHFNVVLMDNWGSKNRKDWNTFTEDKEKHKQSSFLNRMYTTTIKSYQSIIRFLRKHVSSSRGLVVSVGPSKPGFNSSCHPYESLVVPGRHPAKPQLLQCTKKSNLQVCTSPPSQELHNSHNDLTKCFPLDRYSWRTSVRRCQVLPTPESGTTAAP